MDRNLPYETWESACDIDISLLGWWHAGPVLLIQAVPVCITRGAP